MNLKVDSVIHKFGSKPVLSDIFLSLNKGEIVGLLGRNGAGKSTLYKVMFGLLKNPLIRFRVDDQSYSSLYDRKLLQYLPEQPYIPGDLTIAQALDYYRLDQPARHWVLSEVAEDSQLKLKSLSLGKRKYLETIVLLSTDVPFLIMDEPFNGLAPIMVEQLSEYIRNASTKKGIIMTDHLYRPVIELADRLLFMDSGTLREIRDPNELTQYGYFPS